MNLAVYLFAPDFPDTPAPEPHERATTRRENDTATDVSDGALVLRVNAGDAEAFRTIYLTYYAVLHAVARHVTGSADASNDLVQQVFAEIWSRRDRWRPERIGPSLIRAVRYRALNLRQRERQHHTLDHDLVASGDHPGVAVEYRELTQQLARAVSELPERRRTALLLRAVQRMSYAEIGDTLDISEKAAFVLVARARASLEPIRQLFLEAGKDTR